MEASGPLQACNGTALPLPLPLLVDVTHAVNYINNYKYIFSLLVFVNKNRGLFMSNSEIHDINARYNYDLHLPSTNLTLVQKGVLYSGGRIYNHLPINTKILSNDAKRFKSTLKSCLIEHTFYSLDEYYQLTS
jgi:hypothetical protein